MDEAPGLDRLRSAARTCPLPIDSLPTPSGWFAVATSPELRAGSVRRARIGQHELVVWRTGDGSLAAASAWCPHLGAHLGEVGRVRGQLLECGFHGFCFGADGRCVATGYGGRVPARAALEPWPVIEVGGAILLYHDPAGKAPGWTVPAPDERGWTAPAWRTATFAGHPLEITENSVDVGHLRFIHGYDHVQLLEPARVEGPVLRARYQMTRRGPVRGVPVPAMRTEFDVSVHGLGYSRVELTIHTLGARMRLFVLPTPIGDGLVELRLGVSGWRGTVGKAPPLFRHLPAGLAARLVRDFTLFGLQGDVGQDRRVWETKRHLARPLLAEGDGPIGLYRRWAAQFGALPRQASPEGGKDPSLIVELDTS